MENLFTIYENLPLNQLAEKINADFYLTISENCKKNAVLVAIVDNKHALDHIHELVELKQRTLLKYVAVLAEKSAADHDCSICPGGCDMGHAEHLRNIQHSHVMLDRHVSVIDMNEMPDEFQQLSNLVSNLVRVEEQVLMPKIRAAQRKINVVS